MGVGDVSFKVAGQDYSLTPSQFDMLTPQAQVAVTSGGELTRDEAAILLKFDVADKTSKHLSLAFTSDVSFDQKLSQLDRQVSALARQPKPDPDAGKVSVAVMSSRSEATVKILPGDLTPAGKALIKDGKLDLREVADLVSLLGPPQTHTVRRDGHGNAPTRDVEVKEDSDSMRCRALFGKSSGLNADQQALFEALQRAEIAEHKPVQDISPRR